MKRLRDILVEGTRVMCIVDTDTNITKGKVYTVRHTDGDSNDKALIVNIIDDKGDKVGKFAWKFTMVKESIFDEGLFTL